MSLDPSQAHVIAQWKHDAPLNVCRFGSKGKFVFSGSEDNLVERFTVSDGTRILLKNGHDTWVRGLATTTDGNHVISGGSDGKLTWWKTESDSEKPVRSIKAHQGWIRCVDSSDDGKLIASGGNDHLVKIWNAGNGQLLHTIQSHSRHVYGLTFHPDNKSIFTGDLMGRLIQTELKNKQEIASFDAKDLHTYHAGQQTDFGGVRGIAINTEQKLVAAGGTYKATNPFGAIHEPLVLLFDLESGKLKKKLIAPGIKKGVIWQVAWLNEQTLCGVCGGGDGGFLIFWNPQTEKDFHRFKLPNIARDMDVHPDGIRIVTAHHDGHVRITKLAKKT